MQKSDHNIQTHYGQTDLSNTILLAIEKAGMDLDNLKPDDLMPLDEFHVRGRRATAELADSAGIRANSHILDIGSGLGGPSRYLASNFKCRVTGIDLTEGYCRLAELFSEKLGLGEKINYHCGSALEMPFGDESFDIVWTQHTAMNISEKEKLYSEIARVLKPNGALAIYDILAGKNQPIHFPVPWAREQAISFLATFDEMKTYLDNSGMKILSWEDKSKVSIEWIRTMSEKTEKEGPGPLGINLLLGDDFGRMIQNLNRNLTEDRIAVFQIVAQK